MTVVDDIVNVAKQKGVDPYLAIATAIQESGLNPQAVGDQGTSFGLFQLHEGGELGALSPTQAFDPTTNASVALGVFANTAAGNPNLSPGDIAADSQRPADAAGYARSVNGIYNALVGIARANPNYGFNDVASAYTAHPVPTWDGANGPGVNPVPAGFHGHSNGQGGLQDTSGNSPFDWIFKFLFGDNQNGILAPFMPGTDANQNIQKFFTNVFLPATWVRVAAGWLGVVLIIVGIYFVVQDMKKDRSED